MFLTLKSNRLLQITLVFLGNSWTLSGFTPTPALLTPGFSVPRPLMICSPKNLAPFSLPHPLAFLSLSLKFNFLAPPPVSIRFTYHPCHNNQSESIFVCRMDVRLKQ